MADMNLYNENEPFAARWLRGLITAGHIASGVVDERSISDLVPADVVGSGQRHFFAGIAGWSAALRLAGVRDDADIWTGSCPCQPFSDAGRRGGVADDRHLWPTWFGLIRECRPTVLLGEQVASRAGLGWLDAVFADLEGAGYACAAADLPAASVGAPHKRQRLFFVAYRERAGLEIVGEQQARGQLATTERSSATGGVANAESLRRPERLDGGQTRSGRGAGSSHSGWSDCDWIPCSDGVSRPVEPGTHPLSHGVPGRVGLLRGYGNAIVPHVAAAFIRAALSAYAETGGMT